jgi:hypothetical protein
VVGADQWDLFPLLQYSREVRMLGSLCTLSICLDSFNYPQGKFLSHFLMLCVCILQTPDGVRFGLCVVA